MAEQLVAVAVTQDGVVAAHAGRALKWKVYLIAEASEVKLVWTLDLTPMGCLHEWHVRGDGNRHPLHFVDVAIAASAGEGVRHRLQERKTQLLTTREPDPEKAVQDYTQGTLAEGLPHQNQACHHP